MPVIQSTASDTLQRKLLISIHNSNLNAETQYMLSPWIHDILLHTTEELLDYYVNYIVNEYKESTQRLSTMKTIELEAMLKLTHEATKDKTSLSILDSLVPTILSQIDQLDDFQEIIAKFFEYQTSQNKLNDIISSVLLTKNSDVKLFSIIHLIVDRIPNSTWLVQSLLPVIITNVVKNNENADKLLSRAFKDDKLSSMMFSTQYSIDKESQLTPLKVTVDCITNIDKHHVHKVLAILESQWRDSSSSKIWNELHQLLSIYSSSSSSPLCLFIDSSFTKLLEYLSSNWTAESSKTLQSVINVFLSEFMTKNYSKLLIHLMVFLSKNSGKELGTIGTMYFRDQLSSLHLLDITCVSSRQFTKSILQFNAEFKKHDFSANKQTSTLARLQVILQQLNELISSNSDAGNYLLSLLQDTIVLDSLIKLCNSEDENIRFNIVCIFNSLYSKSNTFKSDFWSENNLLCIIRRIEDKNRKIPMLISQFVQNLMKETPSLAPVLLKAVVIQLLEPSAVNLHSPAVAELRKLLTIILTKHPQCAEIAITIVKTKLFTQR